ncbi:MAG: hypothetical protein AAGJ35_07565, partial [Myxococcota bacterium]
MTNVLIVDDETVLRKLYVEAFQLQGFSVGAVDGPDEVNSNDLHNLQLLVVDLMMPTPARWSNLHGMSPLYTGLDLVKEI